MLPRIPPSRCTGTYREEYLDSPDWVAEPKLDGSRYLLHVEGETVNLFARRDFPRTDKAALVPHFARPYPGIESVVLDGEVLIEHAVRPILKYVPIGETTGVMNCLPAEAIKRQQADGCRMTYNLFDILYLNGTDLRHESLFHRRSILESVYARFIHPVTDAVLLVPQHTDKDGLFRQMLSVGLEGTVLKNLNASYGMQWVKNKRVADFSVIISGYKPGKEGKYVNTLGAVAVSVYEEGKLREVGFASGMTDAERDDIWKHRDEYLGRVVDIAAQEVTKDGRLRHPRWLRFRDDVSPETLTMAKLREDAKNARRKSKE